MVNPSNAEASFILSTRMQRFFENHLNPVILEIIDKLLLSTFRVHGFQSFIKFFTSFCIGKFSQKQLKG